MEQLYKNIKARRVELGLTQQELAEKMGYTNRSSIAKIENGAVPGTVRLEEMDRQDRCSHRVRNGQPFGAKAHAEDRSRIPNAPAPVPDQRQNFQVSQRVGWYVSVHEAGRLLCNSQQLCFSLEENLACGQRGCRWSELL